MARLITRHRMPAGTNRSSIKHQTATTQRQTTIPAVLPDAKKHSQLASKMHVRRRLTWGEYFAPSLPISNAARMKAPAVRAIHRTSAGTHGSMAKGVMMMNVVGTFTYNVTPTWSMRAWGEDSLLSDRKTRSN